MSENKGRQSEKLSENKGTFFMHGYLILIYTADHKVYSDLRN